MELGFGAGGTKAVDCVGRALCGDGDDVTVPFIVADDVVDPFDDDALTGASDPFVCAVTGASREVKEMGRDAEAKADDEEGDGSEEGVGREGDEVEEKAVGGGMNGVVAVVEAMLPRN